MDYTNISAPTGASTDISTGDNPVEKEKITPVIDKQNVTVRKAGVGKKLYNAFFSATPEEVARDLKKTVLIPAIKRGILDIITIGASMLINGKDSTNTWSSPYSFGNVMGTIIDYNGISTNRQTSQTVVRPSGPLGVLTLDTIGFTTKADGEVVLYNMRKYLKQYGVVTASEYYDFCGYDHDWQTNSWGWDNLDSAEVIPKLLPNGGRFIISLPPVRPLIKR